MKTPPILFTLSLLMLLACLPNDPASITLITSGYPGGTTFYLLNKSKVDTGYVQNNQIVFHLPVTKYPCNYVLQTKAEAIELWKESNPLIIRASKGQLKNALITGSETQHDADELNRTHRSIGAKQDSLGKLLIQFDSCTHCGDDNRIHELESEYQATYTSFDEADIAFISQHPNSMYAACLLHEMMSYIPLSIAQVDSLYTRMSPTVQESECGLKIKKYISTPH